MVHEVINIGDKRVMGYIVKPEDSPTFLAKKGIYVLSTPRMIALMESNAKKLIDEKINNEEYTSVGYHVDVYHKAPAPAGSKLLFIAEVIEVDGRRVKFRVIIYSRTMITLMLYLSSQLHRTRLFYCLDPLFSSQRAPRYITV